MENHDSMHINPLISNASKYAGFVEKFGTGIPKMLNACKADGNPEPECNVYQKSISLVLRPSEKYMLLVEQIYGTLMGFIIPNSPQIIARPDQ